MMRRLIVFLLIAGTLSVVLSCRDADSQLTSAQRNSFVRLDSFYQSVKDSLAGYPQQVRKATLQYMSGEKDSVVWYFYATLVMKTYFFTFNSDSVVDYYRRSHAFMERQPEKTPLLYNLASEYNNIMGNLLARLGQSDSAAFYFEKAYRQSLKGLRTTSAPDILINRADVSMRQGQYALGAYWYRRALLLCDSLGMPDKKTPIYYGLGQIYMALRDFEQCDHYFERAGQHFDTMLPFEQFIYLNNRGNSYYYRSDFEKAMVYFRRCSQLVALHPDLAFERNLCYLNMSDIFLKTGHPDSSELYLKKCRPFFEEIGSQQALYYIDTQVLELSLMRGDLEKARRIMNKVIDPLWVEPDMVMIRLFDLERYYLTTGDYYRAYNCLKRRELLADSLRGERVRMRVADVALRYAQDSTYMAQNMLIQQAENQMLELRQNRMLWISLCVIAVLVVAFLYLYSKKKRDLLQAQNRRIVSSLRMENIRNRLSPHFIFNLLNQVMSGRKQEGETQQLSQLVKLMRRNLELAEQLCVTLAEEMDFVKTYLEIERHSLGETFSYEVSVDPQVYPEQVSLPSMMIQIPVENAVKHALCDKEGERRLWIDVARCNDGRSGIRIRVTDNGGGYRVNSSNRGPGIGMKVIMQTLQILNSKNKESIDATVHNVSLPDGGVGCEVGFFLPDKYDFRL